MTTVPQDRSARLVKVRALLRTPLRCGPYAEVAIGASSEPAAVDCFVFVELTRDTLNDASICPLGPKQNLTVIDTKPHARRQLCWKDETRLQPLQTRASIMEDSLKLFCF
jgi:hypothetical protein